jgi:hypothetical protein
VISTTDAVHATTSALPGTDPSALTGGTDPAGTLSSVVPSTDLSALPAPDPTSLTPIGDTTGIDPTGALSSVVPSTDLSALPAPDPTSLTPVGDTYQVLPAATDPTTLLSTTPGIHADPSSALAVLDPSAPATGPLDTLAPALGATADTAADPSQAAAAITTQPVVDTVNHAASSLASVQPVSDSLATVAQPAIDTAARTTDVAATTADPVMQAVSTAVQPVVQTIDAAQPAVHATAEAVGPVATVAQAIGDAPAATASPLTTLGGVGQPFGDPAGPAGGVVPAGAPSLADGMGAAGPGNDAIGSMPHEVASALAASTHPAVEGTAHAGALMGTGIDGSAATAASAAGSGGLHQSVPPLDPTYLRYVGLAGLMGLMIQSAARWAEAAGGCGVPTRLALRQFRLLPCMAVGSVERMAHAALAVGSGSTSGTAGHSATRSRSVRRALRPQASPAGRGTLVPTGSGSGATKIVEAVVLTALVLLNFVLFAIRDTFRRNNGA